MKIAIDAAVKASGMNRCEYALSASAAIIGINSNVNSRTTRTRFIFFG
jgi:hypothetical protein